MSTNLEIRTYNHLEILCSLWRAITQNLWLSFWKLSLYFESNIRI